MTFPAHGCHALLDVTMTVSDDDDDGDGDDGYGRGACWLRKFENFSSGKEVFLRKTTYRS